MFYRLALVVPLTLSLAGLAACSKDGPSASPTAATVDIATPTPTSAPAPLTELSATIWLIDVDGGGVITLYRDPLHHSSPGARFEKDGRTVTYWALEGERPVTIRKTLDGTEVSREYDPNASLPWTPTQAGCEVDGRLYAGVTCGSISPSRLWMAYSVNERDLPVTGRASDLWVVDLDTGASRLLQAGIVSCTQCDDGGRLEWSPGGDFLFLAESGGDARVFLINVRARSSREIPTNDDYRIPEWSPTADILAHRDGSGATMLEDVQTGTVRELPELPWPARFDPSGRYLYSVADSPETEIVDVATGKLVAKLSGRAGYDANEGYQLLSPFVLPVAGTADGFVAALGPTPTCKGTMIYVNARGGPCVSGAGTPILSPDRTRVVLARKTGAAGPVYAPTVEAISVDIYDIVLVDVATGRERVLARGALGLQYPPRMVWNEAGTHLLVWWTTDNAFGP